MTMSIAFGFHSLRAFLPVTMTIAFCVATTPSKDERRAYSPKEQNHNNDD